VRVFVEQTINALSVGSIYALIALGVAMVFSILGLINFAHGEFLTVVGYMVYVLTSRGVPWVLVFPGAILTGVIVAVVLERFAFRPVRGASLTTMLIISMAASLMIQNGLLLGVGAISKPLEYPDWVGSGTELAGFSIQWLDVVTLSTTLFTLVALNLFLARTTTGLALRSAASDFTTTRLMGVRANAVVITAFAISGALAGLAAVFYFAGTPTVVPTSGFNPLLKGFIASVIGGIGNLSGAVLGGFLLGFIEVYLRAYLPSDLTGYVDGISFAILIVVLLFRPTGILGAKRI
jgi:branched-chain amino acid transport system permease protein